jgi:hypothetical protein
MSEESGFSYSDFLKMPAHILLGLWNAKRNVVEKRNEEQKKQEKGGGAGGDVQLPANMSSLLGQARGMSSGSVSMPRAPSMPSMPSMPHL